MESKHRNLLQKRLPEIRRDLRVKYVIPQLIERSILLPPMELDINSKETHEERADELIDLLQTRGRNAFAVFCEILQETYPHLAELLQLDDSDAGTLSLSGGSFPAPDTPNVSGSQSRTLPPSPELQESQEYTDSLENKESIKELTEALASQIRTQELALAEDTEEPAGTTTAADPASDAEQVSTTGSVVDENEKCNTPVPEAEKQGHSGCVEALHEADGDSTNKGPSKEREFDPVLIHFYEERGMTSASSRDPLVQEAAKQTGKSVDQVKNFISNFRRSRRDRKRKPPADDLGSTVAKKSSLSGITNRLESEPANHSTAGCSWWGLNIPPATDEHDKKKGKQCNGDCCSSKEGSDHNSLVDASDIVVEKDSAFSGIEVDMESTDIALEESTSTGIAVEHTTSRGQSTMADLNSHAAPSFPITMGTTGLVKERTRKEKALREAAETDQTTRVLQLLAEGVDPNSAVGGLQNTPLHLSAENGHHETVSALLKEGADIGSVDKRLRTPLHLASLNGHNKTLSALLAANADVNARNDKLRTPLHLAATNGHHRTVTALHTVGADVNILDDELSSPLHLAAQNGHHETVLALLEADAYVNVLNNELKTPLHLATQNGHQEAVSILLTAGADVNTWDEEHITPLHMAARVGDHETVSALLKSGADVNARDNQGNTPLRDAEQRGNHECVNILQQHRVDRNVEITPLNMVTRIGDHVTVSAGASRENQGNTPLEDAEQRGHRECVNILQQGGVDRNKEAAGRRKGFDPVLIQFYEERGMTSSSKKDPKVYEAAQKTGRTVAQVLNFIGHYRRRKEMTKPRPWADRATNWREVMQRKEQELCPAFEDAGKKNRKRKYRYRRYKVALVVDGKVFKTAQSYFEHFS